MEKALLRIPYETEEDKQRIETQLRQLSAHPGWQLLRRHLEFLKDHTQQEVNKVGGDQTLKYGEAEIARRELIILQTLINFPLEVIASMNEEELQIPIDQDEHDPYVNQTESFPME